MAKVFHKRSGTTDKGKEYEVLSVANIAMNLANDEKIKDFHISSNDDDFGAFDDVVIEAELENGSEDYAIQLKHSDRGNLSLKQLAEKTGNFSLKKYFDSWQTIKVVNVKLILYTNLKFYFKEGATFQLKGENFFIAPRKISTNDACKISQNDYCYKFSIVRDANYDNSDNILLYQEFFDSFFLYSDQKNLKKLKRHATENFKAFFSGNEAEFKEYVNFINEWSLHEGKIEKLNKKWIKLIIAIKIFSSRIKPLSFNFNNAIEDTDITKRNMLREAINLFDISIFQKESYDQVRELWNDTKSELNDLKTLNKLRTQYHIDSNYFSDIAKIDSLSLSIILWLMGKCPLILKQDASVHKALELCADKKIILLKNDLFPENIAAFKTLSDLESKTVQYKQLLQNLTCSIQGKEEICLRNLIDGNEEILNVIKTDDLLEMAKGQCIIAETENTLPVPYIERSLLKQSIDIKVIDNFTKETQVILDCVPQKRYLKNTLKRHILVDINDHLNAQIKQNQSINDHFCSGNNSHAEFSSLGTVIYLSEKRCELDGFNAICNNAKNVKHFHQFRLKDDGNLEWIRSKGGVSDLEKYKLSQYYSVQERDLSSSEFANNVNLLVSDPGMGKSELMKSLKIKCFADCFTVIIDPQDVHSFLKNTNGAKNYVNIFQKFISDDRSKTLSERDKNIFRNRLKANKIVYVWDALDELSDKYRKIVIDIILELSKNCVQWVTSRCHLQNILERKFNVFSLNLTKFNEHEQSNYIEKRLGDVNSMKAVIISKIKSSFALVEVEHKDILGIPLQLFMLTELFLQDPEKYLTLLDNFFPLTDLYNHFIEDKINKHYTEKLGIVPNTVSAESSIQSQKDKLLEEYTNAALKLVFPEAILKELNVQKNEQSIQLIEENHKNVGLITDIIDQIPRFLHNSFAEYLAARYLANNFKDNQIQAQYFFDPKYNNIRFFFDLLLAKDSEIHLAILYRNFSFIKRCDSQKLKWPDLGGRSVLHLACSWGQRYAELDVKYTRNTCIVDDAKMYGSGSESNEYLETIDYLLEMCNLCKTDRLYNMTPGEYARNTKCLAAEMRIIMKQNIQKTVENNQIINILYYSAFYGYYQEFVYFFQQFKQNSVQQESKLSRNIIVKNNNGVTFLIMAAENGHIKIVQLLVEAGLDINLADDDGFTPLHVASQAGHEQIVKFLWKAGADVNLANKNGATPLYIASQSGHNKIVEFLVRVGAGINLANKDGKTALWIASQNGYDKIVEFLFGAGADINLARKDGTTALSRASLIGHDKIVEFLIKAGAGINLANDGGFTALYAASQEGHVKVVELLVKGDAEINLSRGEGWTALWIASSKGHNKVVEILIKADADINLADSDGRTALWIAAENGHDKVVEFLVKTGADISLARKDGTTALSRASFIGHDKTVEFLIKAGADINLANSGGFTALYAASQEGHVRVVEFLVEAGAEINFARGGGWTALWIASNNGHYKIVEILVEAGAVINLADSDGKTALWMASQNGHDKTVAFLIKAGADINLTRKDGTTALSRASCMGHYRIVEFLIKAGAGINLPNDGGFTGLYAASQEGHVQVVEFLVKAGVEINFAVRGCWTALWIASKNGHDKIVEILVQAGADKNLADNNGYTPLHVATQKGHKQIVEFLLKEKEKII